MDAQLMNRICVPSHLCGACSGSPQMIDQGYIHCHSWDHCRFFYLQTTLSIPKPINSDLLEHQGQPAAGSTSSLESTKSNQTFKQPQDGKDTLQLTTPQQLAGNIDGHKPPVETAITTNTQSYSGAELLDSNIGAAASAIPTEQGLCLAL